MEGEILRRLVVLRPATTWSRLESPSAPEDRLLISTGCRTGVTCVGSACIASKGGAKSTDSPSSESGATIWLLTLILIGALRMCVSGITAGAVSHGRNST